MDEITHAELVHHHEQDDETWCNSNGPITADWSEVTCIPCCEEATNHGSEVASERYEELALLAELPADRSAPTVEAWLAEG